MYDLCLLYERGYHWAPPHIPLRLLFNKNNTCEWGINCICSIILQHMFKFHARNPCVREQQYKQHVVTHTVIISGCKLYKSIKLGHIKYFFTHNYSILAKQRICNKFLFEYTCTLRNNTLPQWRHLAFWQHYLSWRSQIKLITCKENKTVQSSLMAQWLG